MAQQVEDEGGWPLRLEPLNNAVGSISFRMALLAASPTSSASPSSASDSKTESTGSFFQDRSVTLGSLMGVRSILEMSKRSIRRGNSNRNRSENHSNKNNNPKQRTRALSFFSSLCSKTESTRIVNSSQYARAANGNSYCNIDRRGS